ncbi:MAG: hydroxyacid dehydrogenase [Candidatus Micrarchaeia archaeon]
MEQNVKVAFFEVEDWELEYLLEKTKSFRGADFSFFLEELTPKTAKKAKDAEIVSVFIYSKVSKKVLDNLPSLKLVATRSTGFDHVDLKECKKQGVSVCNVPFYGENTVAEHTFGLILALSRKLCPAWQRTKLGNFSLERLRGFDLKGKTLGIIGLGHIGSHVARIAKGFEMNVLAFDVKKDVKLSKKLGFAYVSLDKLLSSSDIVSLHAPYNKNTHHLINRRNIFKMKKGSFLINTARGALVETHALAKALDEGFLGGAGLDVLEAEGVIKEERQLLSKNFSKEVLKTLLKNHVLLERDNVIITPHNAFDSTEAIHRILDTTLDNMKAFKKGRLQNKT